MPLMPCPDCGSLTSTQALASPHCGRQVQVIGPARRAHLATILGAAMGAGVVTIVIVIVFSVVGSYPENASPRVIRMTPGQRRAMLERIEREQFQQWYINHAARHGLYPNPYDPRNEYDYHAA